MYHLKVDHRDGSVKAKRLRRDGIIPATIYGRHLDKSLHIQIPLTSVNHLLGAVSRGGTLAIEVGSDEYNVLFKDMSREPVRHDIEHIEFMHIVADEAVNTVMKVVLLNREKNPNLVQQHIEEIPYNALPRHFVQEVSIDLDGMNAGTSVNVGDLDIARNEDLRLLVPEDTVIVSVAELKKAILPEDEVEEESGEEAQ